MKKVFIFLLLIVPFFYLPGKDLSLAETYYKNRDYGAFIEEIKQVLKDSPKLKEDVTLNAKIAYALSRENRYDDAEVVWRRLTSKNYCTIKDYFWWYRGLNMLNKGDTLKALTIWKEGMNDVPEYSLISRIKYSYSEISAAVHHYKEAQIVLIDLDEKGDYVGYPKDFIWNLIVKYSLITGNEEVVDRYFQKMVTYRPGSKYTYQMAEKFDYFSKALKGSKEDKKKAIKILMGNKKYKECLGYISVLKREDNGSMARALMFYQAEVYFSQKKYNSAYRLYTSLDPGVFRAATRKQIYLQRGRCLYRTNRKAKAYKEFEKLAAKYPRWRKSLDLLWVAAMDYEKKKQFGKAVEWYGKIIRVNPGHEVSWRARFRVGFIYYLQGKQELAVREFKKITDSKIWYLWRDRAFYWMAKSFEAMREFSRAKEIYYDLADHSIADYYTMKSYLIVNFLGADPDWQIPDFSTSGFRLDTYFEKYLTEFLPILTIRDIFGKDEAREKALEYPVDMNRDLSYYLALIYLNQEVGNYGLAYRLQVRIVNQYFSDLPYHLDSPITKFLFPLFYDDEVFQIARKYGINPEFVFAVMRQESAFKPDAESRAGAKGLLQLMPATARELHRQFFDIPWDEERLTDIKYNIKLGTIYLYRLKRQMNGNYFYTLAAYNAGAHRLKRWIKEINTKDVDIFLESITFNETRNYVRACMRNYWVYLIMLGTPPADFAEYLGDSHPILEEKAEW